MGRRGNAGGPGVYPRVCGGTSKRLTSRRASEGLSPRVRGNRERSRRLHPARGSIPACAGEPQSRALLVRDGLVYPRVCGGTASAFRQLDDFVGLSPRVRGNRAGNHGAGDGQWSIPACAGEPSAPGRSALSRQVYPRVCGGTNHRVRRQVNVQGLSPRVRGNQCRAGSGAGKAGSIPACAGEPRNPSHCRQVTGVYPRVCGGTDRIRAGASPARGLSPRVRGNHHFVLLVFVTHGSIPACAGEPGPVSGGVRTRGVYPRVCGGTNDGADGHAFGAGLSPRVRGNRPGYCAIGA